MTLELDSFFLNMTQRIEPFISWVWRKELDCFSNMTQRNELFSKSDSKNWFFLIWLTELNLFIFYDSQNWTFFDNDSKNWTLSFLGTTQFLNSFLIWLKELNSFLLRKDHDSKNWTYFQYDSKYWIKEFNLFGFFFQKKNMTQRIEPFFLNMTLGIDLFWGMTQRFFQNMTLRTELFFSNVTQKNWTFFFWTLLEELNPFYYVFKNWTRFSVKTPGIEPFLNRTQVFCPLNMTQKLIFFSKTTPRIEPSFYMSQWFFFYKTTQRIELFWIWHEDMNFF